MPTIWDSLIVTDEAVATECVGDYPLVVPTHQSLATGPDGAIEAGGWTLTAGSAPDWAARGVAPGCVVVLNKGRAERASHQDTLIVDVVGDGLGGNLDALTLRRVAMGSGIGQPPGNSLTTSGLTYSIPTCLPQIAENQRRLFVRYGIATPVADLASPADFREVLVLMTLVDLYGAQTRAGSSPIGGGGSSSEDNFGAKYRGYKAELDAALAILDSLYGTPGASGRRPAFGLMPETWAARRLRCLP